MISTAGPSRAERVRALGASEVVDNDPGWPEQVRRLGVAAAVNAAPAGAASTIRAVGEGGRVATITSDPPQGERGIEVTSVIVRPDAYQLSKLAEPLGLDVLTLNVAKVCTLDQAGAALAEVVAGKIRGAVVVKPEVRLSADR